MRLSDIMGNAGLAMYAEVALVLFLAVFLAVAVRAFAPGRRAALDRAALLPFDGDSDTDRPTAPAPGQD